MEDAEVVSRELHRLVHVEALDVLVVCHSYGGAVGSQAMTEGWARTARHDSKLSGGGVGLVYMAAFILPLCGSLVSACG